MTCGGSASGPNCMADILKRLELRPWDGHCYGGLGEMSWHQWVVTGTTLFHWRQPWALGNPVGGGAPVCLPGDQNTDTDWYLVPNSLILTCSILGRTCAILARNSHTQQFQQPNQASVVGSMSCCPAMDKGDVPLQVFFSLRWYPDL